MPSISSTRREQPDRAAKEDAKEFLDKNAADMTMAKGDHVTPTKREDHTVETYKPSN